MTAINQNSDYAKSAISTKYKYLIIINIIALLVAPQLNNVHYSPITQFWAEMTFVWLTLSLFVIVCLAFKHISIPKISIPLIMLAIYLPLQQFATPISFVGISYVTSMELIICIFLAISVSSIIKNIGLAKFVIYLSLALLIGGILQSFIGFLQYTGLYTYCSSWMLYDSAHPQTNIFGHFGQRNHYCHYLSWSFFGLIYLTYRRKIPYWLFSILALWFSFSLTIGASRSVFIYFLLAAIIAGFYFFIHKSRQGWRLFRLLLWGCVILFLFEYLYPIILNLIDGQHVASGLERITNSGDGGEAGRRTVEWLKAWITFKQYPIFGAGWYEYAKQSILLQPRFPHAPLNSGLFTNSHNLVLQLLAETGIIGTIIAIGGIIFIIYSIAKNKLSAEIAIIFCMLATTLAHSMLEYPLWYLYFLGPFIIFLSIDKPLFQLPSRLVLVCITIPLIGLAYLMINSSIILDNLVAMYSPPKNNNQAFIIQGKILENIVDNNSLMSYPALLTLDNYILIDNPNTNKLFSRANQFYYVNKLAEFHPYPDTLIKLAKLYANSGYTEKASQTALLAVVSYPVYKASFLASLQNNKYKYLYNVINSYKYSK